MERLQFDADALGSVFRKYGRKTVYSPPQYIFEKGTPATDVGFIVSGMAKTVTTGPEGHEITVYFIKSPNLLCNEGLLGGRPVVCSVQAVSTATVYKLSGPRFWKAFEELHIPPTVLIQFLVSQVTIISDYLCGAHIRSTRERLAYLLNVSIDAFGLSISYTNEQLSALAGVNRVTTNRILKEFEEMGIISLKYRSIRVLDREKLQAVFHNTGYYLE